jgi:hypothetical protein
VKGLLQDVRSALRQLRKNPGFTAITVLTFVLGIGINAAIFTLTYVLVLERLPLPNPTQLVRYTFQNGSLDVGLSGPLFDALIKHESATTGLLAWNQSALAVQENGNVTAGAAIVADGRDDRQVDFCGSCRGSGYGRAAGLLHSGAMGGRGRSRGGVAR